MCTAFEIVLQWLHIRWQDGRTLERVVKDADLPSARSHCIFTVGVQPYLNAARREFEVCSGGELCPAVKSSRASLTLKKLSWS